MLSTIFVFGASNGHGDAWQDFHEKALELCGKTHGGVDIVELGELATALRERLESEVPSKVVFCHNDLQVRAHYGMILLRSV